MNRSRVAPLFFLLTTLLTLTPPCIAEPPSSPNTQDPYAAAGWTPVPEFERVIYVSSRFGRDNNSGTTRADPLRTLDRALIRAKQWDAQAVRLRAGDVFDGGFPTWDLGGTEQQRFWITSYAAGPRPLIRYTGKQKDLLNLRADHVAVVDLAFIANPFPDPKRQARNCIRGLGGFKDWLLEGLYLRGAQLNLLLQTFHPKDGRGMARITLRRCAIVDAYAAGEGHSQGCYAARVRGLTIDQCVFDHNGWRDDHEKRDLGHPTIFNHNLYTRHADPLVITDSLFARASSHGMSTSDPVDATVAGNLFYTNAINALVRGRITVRDNLVLHGRDIADKLPRGWGLDLDKTGPGSTITGNVIAHKAQGVHKAFALRVRAQGSEDVDDGGGTPGPGEKTGPVVVADNLALDWRGGFELPDPTPPGWRVEHNRRLTSQEADTLPHPARTLADYVQHMGGPHDPGPFLDAVRAQHKSAWSPALTPRAATAWIRAGYITPGP